MTRLKHFDTPVPAAPIFCVEREVPNEWLDYNNHMNVGYYGLAFEIGLDAAYDGWLDLGRDYVERSGMGPFALQSNLHYLRELREGDRFRIEMRLLDHDHKRWRYILLMSNVRLGALAATCEQLSMNVDHATRRSTPLPEPQHERLKAMLAAQRGLPTPEQVGAPLGIRRAG